MRGKLRGVPVFKATLSGDSMSSCTSILSGEMYSTVPTRNEARRSIGVAVIVYTVGDLGIVGLAVIVEKTELVECVAADGEGEEDDPDAAPSRC